MCRRDSKAWDEVSNYHKNPKELSYEAAIKKKEVFFFALLDFCDIALHIPQLGTTLHITKSTSL